ncbi:hypothetical protein VTP01DRAFT_4539 [Rhizomucor pusillus]|uniref:uncharacterized protein n=1 Tax=Rhizomucor pusillus TaxID=4840 RepID=UPI003742184A
MSTLNASCLCGCIKITLTGNPIKCMTCHCIDCQKNAGGPYQTNAMFPTSAVNVSDPHGYAKVYTVPGSQVGSGFEKRKWFCGNCGCTLFTRPMKFKGQKTVFKTGLLDASSPEGGSGLELLAPTSELYTKDRAYFVKPIEGAAQFEGAAPPPPPLPSAAAP